MGFAVLKNKQSDSIIHPPCGSNVPGKEEANPYHFYPPSDLRDLLVTVKDEAELEKIDSALRQYERIYTYPGYPWRKLASQLRRVAYVLIRAEVVGPPQNPSYYRDQEVPEGFESILEEDTSVHDNYNIPRFDIPRQGERPDRDIPIGEGDFSAPKDPIMTDVKPRGEGPDPDGMEVDNPPTGGETGGWPQNL